MELERKETSIACLATFEILALGFAIEVALYE